MMMQHTQSLFLICNQALYLIKFNFKIVFLFNTHSSSTFFIVRVPIKIPFFFAQHRPERDRHRIQNNHPFILVLYSLIYLTNTIHLLSRQEFILSFSVINLPYTFLNSERICFLIQHAKSMISLLSYCSILFVDFFYKKAH